jgi:Hypoxia induced protein conserved region
LQQCHWVLSAVSNFVAGNGRRANKDQGIIMADHYSRKYEIETNSARRAFEHRQTDYDKFEHQKPIFAQAKDWASEHRYSIVFAAWVASLGASIALVRRNPYLTTSQKLVQSRMYAQGLTVAVLLSSFALEANDATQAKGRWETIKVLDPNDPMHKHMIEKRIHHERYEGEDQWMEVVAAEEQRIKDRQAQHEKELKTIKEAQEKAHQKHKPQQQ